MLMTTYLVLNAAMFLLGVFCFMQVRQFLSQNSSINGPAQLEDFKRMARINMYVAIVYLALQRYIVGGLTIGGVKG